MSKPLLLTIAAVTLVVSFLFYRVAESPSSKNAMGQERNFDVAQGLRSDLPRPDFELWHEFAPSTGEFTVLLPALPQHATDKIVDPKTNKSRLYEMFVSEEDNGTLFMISVITPSESSKAKIDDEVLKAVINDMLASTPEGKLKEMKEGTYKGNPAIDFAIENGQVKIDGKVFFVNEVLFVLTSVSKKELYQKQKFDFFINSFSLTPAKESGS